MIDNLDTYNTITQYLISQYKASSTWFCDIGDFLNIETQKLKIFYLKKLVWFCERCSFDLQKDDLVKSVNVTYIKNRKRGSNFDRI